MLIVVATLASLGIMSLQTPVHGAPSTSLQNQHMFLSHLFGTLTSFTIALCIAEGPHAPNTGGANTSKTHTSGSSHHTSGHSSSHMTGRGKHPTCTQDHEHTMACGMGAPEHVSIYRFHQLPSNTTVDFRPLAVLLAVQNTFQTSCITSEQRSRLFVLPWCVLTDLLPPHVYCPQYAKLLQGKQDAWSHTQAKTSEASKAANASELAACKANEHYQTLTDSQNNAENARRRQREVSAHLWRPYCDERVAIAHRALLAGVYVGTHVTPWCMDMHSTLFSFVILR